jgi:murein DD-endopeptidase MepM/ murein hydrolase activator NlpD
MSLLLTPDWPVLNPARQRHRRWGGVDVGQDPPLEIVQETHIAATRRSVCLRWLGASVLTGIAGAALLGSAIYIALEGDSTFAERPERALVTLREADGMNGPQGRRKGDRLVRTEMVVQSRHHLKVPVTVRVGDREALRQKSYIRIASNLSLTSGIYATDIPPFNPTRFFADQTGGERYADPVPDTSDSDTSFVRRDLALYVTPPENAALSEEDVAAQIEQESRRLAETDRRTSLPLAPQMLLSATLRQTALSPGNFSLEQPTSDTAFSSIEVRVIPENVTTLTRIDPRDVETLIEEREVPVKKGESLETLLKGQGATSDQARAIAQALASRLRGASLVENHRMRLLVMPGVKPVTEGKPGDGKRIMRVIIFGERGVEAIAAANDQGVFLPVALPQDQDNPRSNTARRRLADTGSQDGEGTFLYNSVFETAARHKLPRTMAEQILRIFGYDIDLQRRVSEGDSFELFFTDEDETGEGGEILYASLTLDGETRRIYRYQSPEDGIIDYLDEMGRSLKKFLMRKPINDGEMRSGFGMRRHPILGYSKMHTGVDWANRIGTPIMAAGNGQVISMGWSGGYGRRIEIEHMNGYVTTYSHLSAFARGISEGAKVRQGQVIGYLGSSGLSTGPHLHYEVMVNGTFVDPLKIRLPRGRELDTRTLSEFRRQRDETNALLQKAGSTTLLAEVTGNTRQP